MGFLRLWFIEIFIVGFLILVFISIINIINLKIVMFFIENLNIVLKIEYMKL